ncbi:VOC family protein [Streptomyces sp. NPDC051976]|uniref:VOC family protein n=1 Tax=Streptomyces sp. NPDC051976 TaxID=3154947 RepID=UPI003428E189
MTSHLHALCFDANAPQSLARFWGGLLDWKTADDPRDGIALVPNDDTGFQLRFFPSQEPKWGPNQIHFDLTSSDLDDQRRTVSRALELGARHIDVGQLPEEDHVVLADPEGNEFCVIGPGNRFLAECGFLGALSSDGSQAVGYFWNRALGWPLVWDQDEETAIRSPHGGPKVTWGGPPLNPKHGRNRLYFELSADGDGGRHAPRRGQQAEVDRLVSLGATVLDVPQGEAGWVVLADPDGNEFCVSAPR